MNFKKSSTELYQKVEELKKIRANEIIRRLTDKMAKSNKKINDLEKNNEDYNKEIEDLKTTNDTIRAAKEAAVEDKRDLESKVKEIQDQLYETKKSHIVSANEKSTELNLKLDLIVRLKDEIEQYKSNLKQKAEDIERYKGEATKVVSKNDRNVKNLENKHMIEKKKAATTLKEVQNDLHSNLNRVKTLERIDNEKTEEALEATKLRTSINVTLEEVREELKGATNDLQEKAKRVETLEKNMTNLQQELEEAKSTSDSYKKDKEKSDSSLKRLEQEKQTMDIMLLRQSSKAVALKEKYETVAQNLQTIKETNELIEAEKQTLTKKISDFEEEMKNKAENKALQQWFEQPTALEFLAQRNDTSIPSIKLGEMDKFINIAVERYRRTNTDDDISLSIFPLENGECTSMELDVKLEKEFYTIVAIQSDPVLISTLNNMAAKVFSKSDNFASDLFAFQSWLYNVMNDTDSILAARNKNKRGVEEEEKSTKKQRTSQDISSKTSPESVVRAKTSVVKKTVDAVSTKKKAKKRTAITAGNKVSTSEKNEKGMQIKPKRTAKATTTTVVAATIISLEESGKKMRTMATFIDKCVMLEYTGRSPVKVDTLITVNKVSFWLHLLCNDKVWYAFEVEKDDTGDGTLICPFCPKSFAKQGYTGHTRKCKNRSKEEEKKNKNILTMRECKSILSEVETKNVDMNSFFSEPVDKTNYPDYASIINEPMDLSTLKSQMDDSPQMKPAEFVRLCRLIFKNAMEYSPDKNCDVHKIAKDLLIWFNKQIFEDGDYIVWLNVSHATW